MNGKVDDLGDVSNRAYGRPRFDGRNRGSILIVLPHTIVRVIYSDETGTGTGSIGNEPLTVVTAIMINMDSQWSDVSDDMAKVRPYIREFKGQRLYRDLRSGRHRDEADTLLRQLLAIPKRRRLPIFYGAVDRVSFKRLKPLVLDKNAFGKFLEDIRGRVPDIPNLVNEVTSAFNHCIDKIDTYVHTLLPGENVLWIADKSQYDKLLSGGRRWFESLKMVNWEAVGISQLNDPDVEPHRAHIVDTIFFGDSHESRALQLADICCSTINLHLRNVESAASYYELIKPQIVNEDAPSML